MPSHLSFHSILILFSNFFINHHISHPKPWDQPYQSSPISKLDYHKIFAHFILSHQTLILNYYIVRQTNNSATDCFKIMAYISCPHASYLQLQRSSRPILLLFIFDSHSTLHLHKSVTSTRQLSVLKIFFASHIASDIRRFSQVRFRLFKNVNHVD